MADISEFRKYTIALCAWREAHSNRELARSILHVISNRAAYRKSDVAQVAYELPSMSSPGSNSSGKGTFTGITTGSAGSANHAVCWKTSTTIGYCSDTPTGGSCTCN
jgi:hypothetical protein